MSRNYGTNVFTIIFFFQAEDGIRDYKVTGVQTCALPICEDGPAGERPERERAHELRRVLGEAHGDPRAEPRQLAEQVHGLVRRDRAGDTEDQLSAGEAHGFADSPSSLTRYSTLAAAISSSAC